MDEKDVSKPQVLRLKAGVTIHGVVRDPEGKPLEGVAVDDGSGKETVTDAKGAFVLRGLRKWSRAFSVVESAPLLRVTAAPKIFLSRFRTPPESRVSVIPAACWPMASSEFS